MRYAKSVICLVVLWGLSAFIPFQVSVQAQDRIVGEIQFLTSSKIVKTSGVWIDGLYVGHLGELKGMNRLRLLPGEHEISIRQAGYSDFNQKVVIEPRMVVDVRVSMETDPRFIYPDPKTGSSVRLDVQPGRAAVFLDDNYVGTVDDFYGLDHAMLVVPGKHNLKIALAGFKTFQTEVDLAPRQKFEIRTNLMTGSINDAGSSIRSEAPSAASAASEASSRAAR